jgi:hypothetical protein
MAMSVEQLAAKVSEYRGATFVTIEARTEPKLLVKILHDGNIEPNPFIGNVVKVSRVNGVINWVYENAVNRQRTREELDADFQAMPRKWGNRLAETPLVEHKGNYYLELKVQKSLGYHYETLDGQMLDTEAVNRFFPKPSASRQGVEREILLRDYSLANIRRINIRGEEHEVRAA